MRLLWELLHCFKDGLQELEPSLSLHEVLIDYWFPHNAVVTSKFDSGMLYENSLRDAQQGFGSRCHVPSSTMTRCVLYTALEAYTVQFSKAHRICPQ